MYDNAGRDCEYGNYRDMNNEVDWFDDFYPNTKRCSEALAEYDWRWREIIADLAYTFGLDTDEWNDTDYEIFCERIGIY